jgi:hypothetical protein
MLNALFENAVLSTWKGVVETVVQLHLMHNLLLELLQLEMKDKYCLL